MINLLKHLIKSEVNAVFCEQKEATKVSEYIKLSNECNNCNSEALVISLNEHISFLQNGTSIKKHD